MAQLIYLAIMSLDGYTADEQGSFDWSAPDEEVHAAVNDLERTVGTYLYGRRMYEVMTAWASPAMLDDPAAVMRDYAQLWQHADKIVYSTTLPEVTTARTRLERDFDPAAVRRLVAAADTDVSIGGPHLAAAAITAGLVDEYQFFVSPVAVGGGTRALPAGAHLDLALIEERRFGNGVVYLRYRAT